MKKEIDYEILDSHVFVTKLAGFEHSEYIQENETTEKINDDDIPLVQGKNIRNGRFVEKYDYYIKKEISDKLTRSKLTKDCILIPYVGSNLGEVGIFYHKYDCQLASNIAKIELRDNTFDLEFLKYYLQSPLGQAFLFQSKQGSAQPNITMEAIRRTNVAKYDYTYQLKIAKVLKLIDDKININNRINDNLQQLILSIYNQWFYKFNYPNSCKTNNNNPININENFCKTLPDGWKIETLANNSLCSFINVGVDRFITKNYLATANVNGYEITDGDNINYENRESRANMQPSLNSVWLAKMKNSIKHIFISKDAKWMVDKYIFSTGFTGFQCTDESFPYIASLIMQDYIEITKDTLAHGATQESVNNDDLDLIPVIIPSNEVLQKYSKIAGPYFIKMNQIMRENQQLSKLRNELLPLLMNGQVSLI